MYAEIEKSGIAVFQGLVTVRFAFYLESFDPRYEEHHIQVPVIPEGGYQGKVDEGGSPVDQKDYDKWENKLPHVWQNNPFHNHFDLVSADIADAELQQLMDKRLTDYGEAWSKGHTSDSNWEKAQQITKGYDHSYKYNRVKTDYDRCVIKGLDIAARADSFKRVK
jgi:hypothetical protein